MNGSSGTDRLDKLSGVDSAHGRAVSALLSRQRGDGCWEGEMVWNTMILSQYVIMCHIVGRQLGERSRAGMIRHYEVTRTPEGCWPQYEGGEPSVFCTTLAYVALRMLGVEPGGERTEPARRWLREQPDGLLAIPTWGKFWLAMIGLYDYDGINPFPPELFLLPRRLPVHPNRLYCHTRNIYQAIAYLYGRRFRAEPGPLTASLVRELYGDMPTRRAFRAHRGSVSATDLHVPPSRLLQAGYWLLAHYEPIRSTTLRTRALDRCLTRIHDEQRASAAQGLSPVNALLNCLAMFAHDPRDPALDAGLDGLGHWQWSDAEVGIRFAGARSHTWDTAFAVEALTAGPGTNSTASALRRAYDYLRQAQLTEDPADPVPEGRDPVRGGWCFSDGGHRWPVSDCTAEAVSALLHDTRPRLALPRDRQRAAVRFILERQNGDGGFSTYERRRAPRWLEALNPAEMFADCMVEGSYTECTGSALTALCRVRRDPDFPQDPRIDRAIAHGVRFLRGAQRRDGSFAGTWGINYTYATFLAVRGLRAAGVGPNDPALVRAAGWLASAQRPDGGWGEHHSGCLRGVYVPHTEGQPVMTSWALLALLMATGDASASPVVRGVRWLCDAQEPDGNWPTGALNGVFFGTGMLHYRLYPSYFPVWALGCFLSMSRA
ncbi:prenyltransferase/squalene oxidase repeat-containing protein [Streptomyces sp. NPDC098781]|uniref:prenyltransferase/squalene oxidase repeat-containing protein n=1 Tax=Streptomyces sp. NPDC098781 TaxID=3366097 RepID=UPI0037F9135F